jgi:cold shock CspA family protein/ribosome-associated translation inhibitor RaiA
MQVPPEIAFRNIEGSPWIEEVIREHLADLEKIFDRLISASVRVERRQNNEKGTIPPVVRIELGMPGFANIVVSHEPKWLQNRYQSPDIHNAISEAFRLAEKQLIDWKDKHNTPNRGGGHDSQNQFVGTVSNLPDGADYGFLTTKEGGQLYFHRNSLLTGAFEDLRPGDEVSYVEEMADTGPIASKVRVKASET